MSAWWPSVALCLMATAILGASHRPALHAMFRWLPVPLWCYAMPMIAVAAGLLPASHPSYRLLTDQCLPVALGLLLLGVDLPAVIRAGAQALSAALIGAIGIVLGAPVWVWVLRTHLPSEAWKGAASLAGTWTGGTMNLLALRSILETPDAVFAPLVVVDTIVAYSWMALLVAAKGAQGPLNRWLRASGEPVPGDATDPSGGPRPGGTRWRLMAASLLLAIGLSVAARIAAARLPTAWLITSANGWVVLLVTTAALLLSSRERIRRLGDTGSALGYPCLYLVLAATGAQGSLAALWEAPWWLVVGFGAVALHGALLLLAGRCFRIPLGILATASQANIGGVVSSPLVGAIYHQRLAPVGLLLAIAGNAAGTYLGLCAAFLVRLLLGG